MRDVVSAIDRARLPFLSDGSPVGGDGGGEDQGNGEDGETKPSELAYQFEHGHW